MRNYAIFLFMLALVNLSGCSQVPSKPMPIKTGTSKTEVADSATVESAQSATAATDDLLGISQKIEKYPEVNTLETPVTEPVENVTENPEIFPALETVSATAQLTEESISETLPVTAVAAETQSNDISVTAIPPRDQSLAEAEKIRKFNEDTRAAQREASKLKQEILKGKSLQPLTTAAPNLSPVKTPGRGKRVVVTMRDLDTDAVQTTPTTTPESEVTIPEYCRSPKKADLWCRIRRGYGLPTVDNDAIQEALQHYLKSEGYLRRTLSRARPYLYHIVKEIERRKLPMELALLPAVESAYQATATSPKSAAGLWQFIPNTGENYGLEQNEWYDERRDVIASTVAALKYLQRLHTLFDGDWLRALAAYNWGEGNVQRAIEKNQNEGKPTDYWSLDMPAETRQYVPKLIALSKIVATPETYAVKMDVIADRPYLRQVEVNSQIGLAVAAQLAGMSSTEFQRFNAAYRRSATAPQGPHKVTLPIYKADQFKKNLAGLKAEDLMPPAVQAAVAQEIQRDGGAVTGTSAATALPVTDAASEPLIAPAVGELATVPVPRRAN